MSSETSNLNFEDWTIQRLVDASRRDLATNHERIVIPPFQRQLKWNREKQHELIQSIKQGYPIGAILLSEEIKDGKRQYQLIDGLQRTNAIQRFYDQPNEFYDTEKGISQETVNIIINEFGLTDSRTHEQANDKVRKVISNWIRTRKELTSLALTLLTEELIVKLLDIEKGTPEFTSKLGDFTANTLLRENLDAFLEIMRKFGNIGNYRLPVYIYSGETHELPRIFELLNTKGVMLSRYEIYAARWINPKYAINNPKIREAIWKKYEHLEDAGFNVEALEERSDSHSEEVEIYSLFEYLFGFGQQLSNLFPRLFRKVAEEEPSSAGFNLVTACLGIRLQEMDSLNSFIQENKIDINQLEVRIIESVKLIDEILRSILRINYRAKIAIHHTEFQIISLIASAFQSRFGSTVYANLKEREDWKSKEKTLKQNLLMHYLYDVLRNTWSGTGDTRVTERVKNQYYLSKTPSRSIWDQELNEWYEQSQKTMSHVRRYIRAETTELLWLKFIYSKKLTVFENENNFHIEHIVPVARLSEIYKEGNGGPINSVANLALLEREINRRLYT